ncbi:protein FAM184A-like [Ostrea edulis]|uniref:protein FAM184A-like n=1 Tax=Ostrea edulis TaxID=37623 RepID=UPI0024AFEEB9|nr:protein FAM184A-like [Ostrea edulis]
MATSAKSSFNHYQNGKYGTLPGNPNNNSDVTQDMHLKMSKKIAQLTKVIYALNTKNDEHEAVVQTLKEQHEEQIQQLLSETREKILKFKQKIDNDSDHKHTISNLQNCVAEHEKHKKEALLKFESYKRQAEERETNLKTEHSQKYLELSQEVLVAKRHFEEQLSKFELWRKEVDSDKEIAIEEQKKVHIKEMDELRDFYRSQNNDWLNECAKIEDKYKTELEGLKTQCSELNTEKQKLTEDYESKLAKAKAFYEKELEVLQNAKDSSVEDVVNRYKEEQEKLKKDFQSQQKELKLQIERLVSQLSVSEENVEKFRKELEDLKESMKDKDATSSGLFQQLQQTKLEASDASKRLKELQSELVATKERCSQQADDINKKSVHIGQLEGTNVQKTSKIKELEDAIQKLKDRLNWLESERKSLENQKTSLSENQKSQLQSLEQSLEDLSIEKQTIMTRLEREILVLKEKSTAREKELTDKHTEEVQRLNKAHSESLELTKQKAETQMAETKQEMLKKYHEDVERLNKDKSSLLDEFERTKQDLINKLATAEAEVQRLEKIVRESENGLGTASSQINSLKDASHRLQSELEKTREELRSSKTNAANLKMNLDKLQNLYDAKMIEAQAELKTKLEKLSVDLESRWSDTLKKETTDLRRDLTQQKEDEKKAALQQLSRLKDEEIAASKRGWENIVNELQKQVSELKSKLNNAQTVNAGELDRLQREAAEEKRRLEERMAQAAEEFAQEVAAIEAKHAAEVQALIKQKEEEIQELESSLKSKHLGDMQTSITAHKAALEGQKLEAEKVKQQALEEQNIAHQKVLETTKEELHERHVTHMTEITTSHEQQMEAARLELERAVEISHQRDRDHCMQIEELKAEITQRERHIKNLQEEIQKLKDNIDRLMRELEQKGKEMLKVRNDANLQLKKKEEVLNKRHLQEIENIKQDFSRESESMMSEFTEAQEILKDKISELQIMLDEAEERYSNRDSRPEDLELIQQLRDAIAERESRMKQLIDEKRYYQLELVNRETNFNKVFNNNTNVGVINPLAKKQKKGEKAVVSKHASQPNLGSHRLDPLPNSPMHHDPLNPSRPLPSFTKKFVK